MQKIKENLESFFITWGVVLLLNQVFLFHGCFNPVCLIAALPHTGVIAFIILIFFINDEKNKNKKSIDIKNEYDESEIMRRYSEGYKIVRELNRKNTPSQNSIKPREQEVKIVENLISDLEKNNEIQEENKICKITQVKNFLHSFEPFEITIMDVRNNILQINTEVIDIESIDSNDYFIEIPQNDTWKNVALKSGDKCLVKKQSYGTKIELNLLEINSEKIKSKITKLPKAQKDIELESLKKELKTLESKLQELVEQKSEYLNDIEEFNREYNLHLGELVKDILNLKREILYKKTINQQKQKARYQKDLQTFQESKETIDELKSTIAELEEALESIDEDDENYEELTQAYNELKEELEKLENELELQEKELELEKEYIEDETIEQEYEEVNNHYEEFESEYEHIKKAFENSIILNDEEKKELKSLYKQAARLCHPDIVPDELKEKAHELMQKLNDAYSKKDISKVKEILHSLQNGTSFEVSSETIEDKELLKAKIKEYLKNIETIKSEIEEIKEDETYQTIAELDDWDEYFEELKDGLKSEKERLQNEAREVLEEKIPEWMQTLWNWAEENNLNYHYFESENTHLGFPLNTESLMQIDSLEISDAWTLDPDPLPLGIGTPIPDEICNLKKLKKLRIMVYGNEFPSKNQLEWLNHLLLNGCKIEIWDNSEDTYAFNTITNESDIFNKEKNKTDLISTEDSYYSKHIHSIENIKFEKIRKYCENLSKENEADEMQKQLAEKGKMYKALIYSTLEVFIEKLNGETITLCDWGCSQGIASMLVLDYIKEKQLDIKVSDVILIDDDTKALNRAIAQVEVLAQDTIKFTTIKSDDNNISDTIKSNKNNIVLNIFANDKIPVDLLDIDYDIFGDSYFLCVSNENKEFVDEVYENTSNLIDVQDVSIRDGKIGRFQKFERIFAIDNNEIPF